MGAAGAAATAAVYGAYYNAGQVCVATERVIVLDEVHDEFVEASLKAAENVRLGLVAEYEHPILGTMRQFGTLIDFSDTPGKIHGPPPLVGEHTREILEWLGYEGDEMDRLKNAADSDALKALVRQLIDVSQRMM